jgi:hypothetical protein
MKDNYPYRGFISPSQENHHAVQDICIKIKEMKLKKYQKDIFQ